MRSCLFILLFSGLFFSLDSAPQTAIVSGHWNKLYSKVLQEDRQFAVYLPPGYSSDTQKAYSVVYVLDGDETRFKAISSLVEALSSDNLDSQIPELIVVGIPNTNRVRDLTTSDTDFIFKGRVLDTFPHRGGASKFAAFIEQELFQLIEKQYRTNGKRALVGQSFGGLATGHILLTKPHMFNNYLMIDATYLWDDNYLNRLAKDKLDTLPDKPISIFIALANNDHLGEIGITNRAWGNEFIERLSKHKKLLLGSRYFEDERHATVELQGWYHGIRFLFGQSNE